MADSDNLAAEPAPKAGDTLAKQLLSPGQFAPFIADCKALVAAEIKKKGMAIRTAFKIVQKLKPDILERTVREVMPDFVHALEPCYTDYRAQGRRDFRGYLIAHEDKVADAALAAADQRADNIYSRTIRSAYDRVRGRARREILDAMPGIADTLSKHV